MIALFIVGVMTAVTSVSLWAPHLRVCATDGGEPTCRPVELTDAPVVLGALFVFLLILPGIKSLKLPGGIEYEKAEVIARDEDLTQQQKQVDRKGDEYLRSLTEGKADG